MTPKPKPKRTGTRPAARRKSAARRGRKRAGAAAGVLVRGGGMDTHGPAAAPVGSPGGMEDWDTLVADSAVFGRCAANAAERHVVLDHAISNVWAAEDIGTIRRVESNGRCMWVMWRRTSAPPL
jgi:hypothetical protein